MAVPLKREESDSHKIAREALASLKITMRTEFVPWSKSRSFTPGPVVRATKRTLNWKVTLQVDGRDIVTVDYSAGCAACPAYHTYGAPKFDSEDAAEAIRYECETGKTAKMTTSLGILPRAPILPDLVDVVYAVRMDGEAIDYSTYEAWADNFGYDVDSRKGEAAYRECLKVGLALRAALGEAGLKALADAYDGY